MESSRNYNGSCGNEIHNEADERRRPAHNADKITDSHRSKINFPAKSWSEVN